MSTSRHAGKGPAVLTDAEVGAELERLAGQLRAAREAAGVSTRQAAARAGMNQGTLWRLETARTRPTFLRFARLAAALDLQLELDDGREPIRRPVGAGWPLPPGYWLGPVLVEAAWPQERRSEYQRLHSVRCRLGAELWWARYVELDPALDGQAVCRLLGMSHHTLAAVESGPDWPDTASIVLLAGLTGRRVELVPASSGLRLPPWAQPRPAAREVGTDRPQVADDGRHSEAPLQGDS